MILVMGASGNVGSEVVKELKKIGAEFRAAYRSPEQIAEARKEGIETVELDYSTPETLRAALAGTERVFFVTSPSPHLAELENNILEAVRSAGGVRHLVKLSVWGAEGGDFIFGRPHREVEKEIESSGIAYTFLRPNGFMQNMLGQAQSIKNQSAFYLPAGSARVSEIDVRDIGRVAATVLTTEGHEGMAYQLSGPSAMTYSERAQVLTNVLGKRVDYVSLPDDEWKRAVMGYGLPEWQADGIIDLAHYYNSGKAEQVTTAVRDVTKREPITYQQFVEDHAQLFR